MPVAKIPLSALRVLTGKVAATLDMAGFDPCSIVVAASDLDEIAKEADKLVRRSIGAAFQGGDDNDKKTMTPLWLALNHPHHADQMRAAMSGALRRDSKAHLSVTVDAGGTWAFGLADRFVDAAPLIAALPENTPVSLSIGKVPPARPMQ